MIGAATYALLQLGVLASTQWAIFVFIFGAGPVAFVGLIFGLVSAAHRIQPRWLAFVGIALSCCALVYNALEFLYFLAQIAFA
jgi:type III secretory pathway component EscS